jgi:hypothetical protein
MAAATVLLNAIRELAWVGWLPFRLKRVSEMPLLMI